MVSTKTYSIYDYNINMNELQHHSIPETLYHHPLDLDLSQLKERQATRMEGETNELMYKTKTKERKKMNDQKKVRKKTPSIVHDSGSNQSLQTFPPKMNVRTGETR